MFTQLPDAIQKEVIGLLEIGRFVDAKAIYDSWIIRQPNEHSDRHSFRTPSIHSTNSHQSYAKETQ